MSDANVKIKITAEGKQAKAELGNVGTAVKGAGAAVKSTSVATGTGAGMWAAYTGAVKAATVGVRGFFSALGLIGAIMGGISMVISLCGKLKDVWNAAHRAQEEAAERAKQEAEELKQAEEEAARAAKERFDAAKDAADEYIRKLKEALDIEKRAADNRAQVRSARAERENVGIDAMQARGEISAPAAAAEKEMVSLRAQRDNIEEQIATLEARLRAAEENVDRAEDAKVDAEFALGEARGKDEEAWAAARAIERKKGRPFQGILARNDLQRQADTAWMESSRTYQAVNRAEADLEAKTLEREAADAFYEEVYGEVTPALELLRVQLETVAAKMAANDEKVTAMAREDGSEALAAARRSREKADIDAQVSRGEKSQEVGALEKKRIDLEKQLADAQAAVEKREQQLAASGMDLDEDKVLAALREGAAEAQTRLDINSADLEKARSGGAKTDKASASTVTAGSDPWKKVGAFVGNGRMNDRQLQVAMRSMTLLERSNVRLGQILAQLEKMEATT